MKKMLYKNKKQYEDIEGLSAAKSNLWDRLTKNFIDNSINQWRMRLESGRRQWTHSTSNLTTLIHDSTYISVVIVLFIIRKLNMIK